MTCSIPKIQHINSRLANKKLSWVGCDSEQLFNRHMNYYESADLLKKFGWDQPDKISYCYNSHGFRTVEFTDQRAGLALGCSFTEGLGLPIQFAWPSVLQELIDFPIWNLGVSGGSGDLCFRLLDHYLKYLNIELVVMCLPHKERIEFFDSDGLQFLLPQSSSPKYAVPYYKNWLLVEKNARINQRKNVLAMQKLCDDKKIKFACLSIDEFGIVLDSELARDLGHPGIEPNKKFAHKMLRNL